MQIIKEDEELDALIDLFNEQTSSSKWDEAYGTSLAIIKAYRDRADNVESSLASQLRLGLINRAKHKAEMRKEERKCQKKNRTNRGR